jgi:cbb3-type cytochrome oxidase subunit 3
MVIASAAGPSWTDISTAVGTVVLAIFAVVTAWYARKAFRKQSKEVSDQAKMLELQRQQLAEQQEERRRAQALRVFVGAPPGLTNDMAMFARNASEFPVYDAQIWYLQSGGLTGPEKLGIIMPGTHKDVRKRGRRDAVATAVLAFRDAAGIRWIRMPDGTVSEQSGDRAEASILAMSQSSGGRGKGSHETG